MAAFGRILAQLFANLAVNFIPETETPALLTDGDAGIWASTHKVEVEVGKRRSCAVRHLRVGRKMPLPMMKCSFSRLEVGRSSSMLLPSSLGSPSVSRLVT